jgi:DNA-binding NtrC family response regulator
LERPTLVLVDVDADIAAALRHTARQHGIAVTPASDETRETGAPVIAALVAVGDAKRFASPGDTARLRRSLGGAPLVALVAPSRRPDPEATPGLAAAGFHTALRAGGRPDPTLPERAVQSAVAARRAVDLDLVGGSNAMARLREELLLAATAPSHVLLLGETGTGKGVAARALHALSPRRDEPFATLDCTALSPTLVESELFGHERGAFTGAHERRRGRLELAGRGTLFLDEIGELELGLQAKLLRALEERRFERIGGRAPLALEARVVAATHRDLLSDVRAGRFRRDLFYRLDVLRVRVPPLRDRRDDIPLLVDHLLRRAARRLECEPLQATPALIGRLRLQDWPGNVRELANRLEALSVRSAGGEVDPWSGHTAARPESVPPASIPGSEQQRLAELLQECGGNVARVARRLGRPRSTVRYRIARHGLAHLIPRD